MVPPTPSPVSKVGWTHGSGVQLKEPRVPETEDLHQLWGGQRTESWKRNGPNWMINLKTLSQCCRASDS